MGDVRRGVGEFPWCQPLWEMWELGDMSQISPISQNSPKSTPPMGALVKTSGGEGEEGGERGGKKGREGGGGGGRGGEVQRPGGLVFWGSKELFSGKGRQKNDQSAYFEPLYLFVFTKHKKTYQKSDTSFQSRQHGQNGVCLQF